MDDWQWEALFVNRGSEYYDVRIEFPEKHKKHVGLMIENTDSVDQFCQHDGCRYKFDLQMNGGKYSDDPTIMSNKILYFRNNVHDPSLLRQTLSSVSYQDLAVGVRTGLANMHVKIVNTTTVYHLGTYTILQEVSSCLCCFFLTRK